jgi:hypothetical protein
MDNLLSIQLTVTVYLIMILLIVMTVTLLFGYLKLGLFFNYVFLFYWGNFFSLRSVFENIDPNVSSNSVLYIGFGLMITFLAMIGFIFNKN